MPKQIILFVSLIISLQVKAQIKKSSIVLGGQFSFFSQNFKSGNDNPKAHYAFIYLSVGTAYKNNHVVGLGLTYGNQKEYNRVYPDTLNSSANYYRLGVFYRLYKQLNNKFYVFCHLEAGGSFGKQTFNYSANSDIDIGKSSGGYIAFLPGIAYEALHKFYLELLLPDFLNLSFSKNTFESNLHPNSNYSSNTVNFNTGLNGGLLNNIGVGFKFIF